MLSLSLSQLGIPTRDDTVLSAPGPAHTKLPLPIINLGLPKSASASILDFFTCSGMKTSHSNCENDCSGTKQKHEYCKNSETAGTCGACISENIHDGQPPFEGCGEYVTGSNLNHLDLHT